MNPHNIAGTCFLVLGLGLSAAQADTGIDIGGLLGGDTLSGIDLGGLLGEGGLDMTGLVEADVAGMDLINGGAEALVDVDVLDHTGLDRSGPEMIVNAVIGEAIDIDGADGLIGSLTGGLGDLGGVTDAGGLLGSVSDTVQGLTGGLTGGLLGGL